jgi:hypothetical protein
MSCAQARVLQSTNSIDHVVDSSGENVASSLRVFALLGLVLVALSVLLGRFLATSAAGSDGCYRVRGWSVRYI